MYSTIQYLSTGISNQLQPAQAEVVLGQLSTYLASWITAVWDQSCGGGEGAPGKPWVRLGAAVHDSHVHEIFEILEFLESS